MHLPGQVGACVAPWQHCFQRAVAWERTLRTAVRPTARLRCEPPPGCEAPCIPDPPPLSTALGAAPDPYRQAAPDVEKHTIDGPSKDNGKSRQRPDLEENIIDDSRDERAHRHQEAHPPAHGVQAARGALQGRCRVGGEGRCTARLELKIEGRLAAAAAAGCLRRGARSLRRQR